MPNAIAVFDRHASVLTADPRLILSSAAAGLNSEQTALRFEAKRSPPAEGETAMGFLDDWRPALRGSAVTSLTSLRQQRFQFCRV
jgi:hypothetical protein